MTLERSPRQHDFRLSEIRDSWACRHCGARASVLPKDWRCPGTAQPEQAPLVPELEPAG